MKHKPMDASLDSFLQGTMNALKRAGKRARRKAEETGTCLIIGDGEKILRINPKKALGSKKP